MITTVTMNPSVDKLYLVESLEKYEVMRVQHVCNTAGGKGLNVSKIARLLGEEVTATGFLGGFNGGYVQKMLEQQDVKAAFTKVMAETRSCINIRENRTGKHTELLEPGLPVTEEECREFLKQYQKLLEESAVITISGSAPKGIPVDFYGQLVDRAKKAGVPVILDTSGNLLKEAVKAKPTMVKPNVEELGQLLGQKVVSFPEMIAAAQKLQDSGITYVVVSMGKDGALMVCQDGIFRGRTPDVPVANTVGCGDSMVAGFAVSLANRKNPEEMLRLAMAVSTANAMNPQTGFFERQDLDTVFPLITVEKI